jgi:transcriptional regulator with PAS, ATPase and Fis domain
VGQTRSGQRTLRETSDGEAIGRGILLITGDGLLRTFRINGDEIVIGRASECDVVLEHPALSRRHACLRLGPRLTVQDLGSTNGTRVQRRTLRGGDPVPLEVGESFHVGKLSLVVMRERRAQQRDSAAVDLTVSDPTPDGVPALVRDVASSGVNVLVLGETGVGKELLAETLHQLSGRKGPLLRVNCAALAPLLLESELFGHEKGAFTGATHAKPGLLEAADGGTAFLDEIGELPDSVQVKLLRVLETREVLRVGAVKPRSVDVRFVSATNRDLAQEVAAGHFRSDLFYRLDGISLTIPPLRERRHQISRLGLDFLRAAQARQHPERPLTVAADLFTRLEAHHWPGNVRELKAVLERAVLLARGGEITTRHVSLAATTPAPRAPDAAGDEKQRVLDALAACAGNQTRAAKRLGISRTKLLTLLAIHGITRPRK